MPSPLEIAHDELGWPSAEEIFAPTGPGVQVLAALADRKIASNLRRLHGGYDVRAGVLVHDPSSPDSSAPIAIVCEFAHQVPEQVLKEAHRLAWNFSRSPLLITIEPHRIRTWTCCEIPARPEAAEAPSLALESEATKGEIATYSTADLSSQAADALNWVSLVTGQFIRENPERFQAAERADETLLSNLRVIRTKLHRLGLGFEVIHDLLARIIFIQFLLDRKDSSGRAALDPDKLKQFYQQGRLRKAHTNLGSVLRDREDTYVLFEILNERFNGDLFHGDPSTTDRSGAWEKEKDQVQPPHLSLLADFVEGHLKLGAEQYSLWREYSFDAIPLEFISSIYEEFVAKKPGVVYTPSFLVDFVLDSVLSWGGTEWDVKILDPACGSGIFLVKAFQRLIQRWKNAHSGAKIEARHLRRILEKNIVGVDVDPHAVRVASFSLYLAMCDEIDPKQYWHQVSFPELRNRRIIHADFFDEQQGIHTDADRGSYDLVIGNVPWARRSLLESTSAEAWARRASWKTYDKNIGPLFIPKAARLVRAGGRLALLQPASLLFNAQANHFRERLFKEFDVEMVVNLSVWRHILFPNAISPSCIIALRVSEPGHDPIVYISPKPTRTEEDLYRITIEPHDIAFVSRREAIGDNIIWSALLWGGRRDLALLNRLKHSRTLKQLTDEGIAKRRKGIVRGEKDRRPVPAMAEKLELAGSELPTRDVVYLKTEELEKVRDLHIHSPDSDDMASFEPPQLIIKKSWSAAEERFRAALVLPEDAPSGVVCTQSFVSVHVPSGMSSHLEAACLAFNSTLAVYYLLLTSGRTASYRPEATLGDILRLPYPDPKPGMLVGIKTLGDVDARMREFYALEEVEWALIEDLHNYTMLDFQGGAEAPGRLSTLSAGAEDVYVVNYSHYFLRVLRSNFGDVSVSATIYQAHQSLPVRLLAFHLDWPGRRSVVKEPISSERLLRQLNLLSDELLTNSPSRGVVYQRVTTVYSSIKDPGSGRLVPTVYIIKPDQIRYWTRSAALRDADEVVADAMMSLGFGSRLADTEEVSIA